MSNNRTEPAGKVWLVGAGPGDAGLMTLKGKRLLETVDVVIYDRLVDQEIMEMISAGTERIDVGKNAGHHPVPQNRINEILLEQALAGKRVVRLKGGDPFVFGRGGEELELLEERGIAFEVVPGITSAVAAAAYGGIPVTHRDFCSSVHFITGHARAGKELEIDYEALVRLKGTLVFLMGVSNAGQIARGLLTAGMDPAEPTGIVENGTRSGQRTFVQPLSGLKEAVKEHDIHSPALILVGKVCSLADKFSWFDRLPLKGKRVLVTRPEAGASRLAEGLRQLGAQVTVRPAIRTSFIRPLRIPEGIAAGDSFDTVVFTSAVGVQSYCRWLLEEGQDMRWFAGRKIACIGSATVAALKEFGLAADFVPTVFSGEALGREMIAGGFVTKKSRVLLLRTDIASWDVTDELEKAGVAFADVPVYRTEILAADDDFDPGEYDVVTFTSRSCVEGFTGGRSRKEFEGCTALCIGEKTGSAARRYGFDVVCSEEATIGSIIAKAMEII